MNAQDRIIIFDTTLRDGEQSPGASMNAGEKLRLAIQLENWGWMFWKPVSRQPLKAIWRRWP